MKDFFNVSKKNFSRHLKKLEKKKKTKLAKAKGVHSRETSRLAVIGSKLSDVIRSSKRQKKIIPELDF